MLTRRSSRRPADRISEAFVIGDRRYRIRFNAEGLRVAGVGSCTLGEPGGPGSFLIEEAPALRLFPAGKEAAR